jgi:hypothetical protein
MTTPALPPSEEDAVLAALGQVYDQLDPVPDYVDEGARAVFELRDLDAQLIPLLELEATTLVRGATDHWFTFALDGLEVELGAHRGRSTWELVGQVSGAVREMVVQTLTGAQPVAVDELGRFTATVSAPTLRLRLVTDAGKALRTEWVTL